MHITQSKEETRQYRMEERMKKVLKLGRLLSNVHTSSTHSTILPKSLVSRVPSRYYSRVGESRHGRQG